MFCKKCGNELAEGAKFCNRCGLQLQIPTAEPVQPKPTKEKVKKAPPSKGVRVVLCLLSILVCLCLTISLLLTALAVDMRRLMDADSVDSAAESVLQGNVTLCVSSLAVSDTEKDGVDQFVRDQLVEIIHEMLNADDGLDENVTREQVDQFLEDSTIEEYLTDKIAGYAMDMIMGTDNTSITVSEILELLEENEEAFEENFGVELDGETIDRIRFFLEKYENRDGSLIGGAMEEFREEELFGLFSLNELSGVLKKLTSTAAIGILAAVDLFLVALLLCLSRFRIGNTLIYSGVAATLAGGALSILTLILQLIPSALESLGIGFLADALYVLLATVAPVHYILAGCGILVLLTGIIVAIIAKQAKQ